MNKCNYDAKIILIDRETYTRDMEFKGRADKVLMEAIKYISEKDSSDSIHKGIINYIIEDFKAFDKKLNNLFLKKK